MPAQVACPPRGTPLVRVTVSDPDPRVLPPVSAEQLRRLAEVPEEAQGQGTVLHHLGLTLSRVEWRSEITVRSQGVAEGPVCGLPSEVRLSLVHAEHSIRLAREIPRNGCLAREVLAHERRHAEVNRRTLREAAEGLRLAARNWAARAQAQAPDAGAAALLLQEDLTAAVEPVLARLRAAREAGHDAIDTPREYRRLGRVCPADQRRLNLRLGAH
ncbi:hypothetical protein [Falsiroseomonas tokyonensis]|uniref:DUF922 domain-containing protein n=1 Tax=Falsiroseomonas tokyonensis TaxID=430521 RepID=A0ABV7BX05_9PROT|nr:hypothetical protein [Falsiroseomonas tokyonensis]MBU8538934.1 hypothetical protein [Falsiroseomonas tokyonensis]